MLILRAYPDEWASDFSEELEIEAAQDLIAPVAPSGFALSSIAEGIELTWDNPTINVDGTACNDLAWIAVYRKADSGGIDPENDATYDKRTLVTGEAYTYPSDAAGTTFYFIVTAVDRTGNESEATGELSDSPDATDVTPVIPDDASGLIFNDAIGGDGVVGGHAMLGIAFKAPADTWVGFDRYRLWWQYSTDGSIWRDADGVQDQWTEIASVDRRGFLHKGLDATGTKAYRYKATVVATDGTESSTADTAGGAATTADAVDNTDVVAITIFAMNIVCLGEVTAPDISCDNLAAINANIGTVTAGTINATVEINAAAITTGMLDFAAISRDGLNVLNSELAGSISSDKIASLDAAVITAGIITARQYRTANTNTRLEIMPVDGDNHRMLIYYLGVKRASYTYGGWAIYDAASMEMCFANTAGTIGCDLLSTETIVSRISGGAVLIDQTQAAGANPVIILDQADASEGFINFLGEVRGVITGATNSAKSVRAEVNGVVGRLAIYADG